MDPENPEGSYDACIAFPDNFRGFCKVQIDPCEAAIPNIMGFVTSQLRAMRAGSCESEVKKCVTKTCGEDFSGCLGMDTDSIIRTCPTDQLMLKCTETNGTGKKMTQTELIPYIIDVAQSVMISVDNSAQAQCQAAANAAMEKVCGSTTDCNQLAVDPGIGATALEYKICGFSPETRKLDINQCLPNIDSLMTGTTAKQIAMAVNNYAPTILGLIYWDLIDFNVKGTNTAAGQTEDMSLATASAYEAALATELGITELDDIVQKSIQRRVVPEIRRLQSSIKTAIDAIESDKKVMDCMHGRQVQGMITGDGKNATMQQLGRSGTVKDQNGNDISVARYPGLTNQMRMIITAYAVRKAKENYDKKFAELEEKQMEDFNKVSKKIADLAEAEHKEAMLNARRNSARIACVTLAGASILAQSPAPPKGAFGTIASVVAIAGAAIAIPFTGGLSGVAIAGLTASAGTTIAVAGAGIAAVGLATSGGTAEYAQSGTAVNNDPCLNPGSQTCQLVGSQQLNQWNFKQTITSTFAWETLKCRKCTVSQRCGETKSPWIGNKYCKKWEDPTEQCNETQF
jgi:phage regulator Rha-like protein